MAATTDQPGSPSPSDSIARPSRGDSIRFSSRSVRHERHLSDDQAVHESTEPAKPLPLPLDVHRYDIDSWLADFGKLNRYFERVESHAPR